MRPFQAALDTPLDSPFSATLSVHGSHFTVCAPSIKFSEKIDRIFFLDLDGPVIRINANRGDSRELIRSEIGDRQPRTTPTKDLLHRVVFLGGWCASCRKLRKRQNTYHPQFCTRDVDCRFCGGGAWISRSDETPIFTVFERFA